MPKTLRESLSTRHNALNFVRLTLAFVVIFGHAWPLGGFEGWTLDLGGWAVQGFFAISGYLIAGSRMRLGIREYLASRALRIFPAYWSVLILTAFALALAIGENYEPSSALSYVISNAGLYQAQWGIDDTLVSVPVAIAWNGSLWSLFPVSSRTSGPHCFSLCPGRVDTRPRSRPPPSWGSSRSSLWPLAQWPFLPSCTSTSFDSERSSWQGCSSTS